MKDAQPRAPAVPLDLWCHRALLDGRSRQLALFAVAASLVLPFEGLGVDLCPLHALTQLPCPGCGLTRAFVLVAAGELRTAVGAHPFVLALYPLFLALAALELLPSALRGKVEALLERRGAGLGRAYRLGVVAFLGFGLARLLGLLALGERFP